MGRSGTAGVYIYIYIRCASNLYNVYNLLLPISRDGEPSSASVTDFRPSDFRKVRRRRREKRRLYPHAPFAARWPKITDKSDRSHANFHRHHLLFLSCFSFVDWRVNDASAGIYYPFTRRLLFAGEISLCFYRKILVHPSSRACGRCIWSRSVVPSFFFSRARSLVVCGEGGRNERAKERKKIWKSRPPPLISTETSPLLAFVAVVCAVSFHASVVMFKFSGLSLCLSYIWFSKFGTLECFRTIKLSFVSSSPLANLAVVFFFLCLHVLLRRVCFCSCLTVLSGWVAISILFLWCLVEILDGAVLIERHFWVD